jgi:hypothetical protein
VSERTPFSVSLGATIRAARKKTGLGRATVAAMISREYDGTDDSVAVVTLSSWEMGVRALTVARFHATAQALGIDEAAAIDRAHQAGRDLGVAHSALAERFADVGLGWPPATGVGVLAVA